MGAPDIIVNSAGITKDGFLLRMKEQKLAGSIVNIASIVGRTGNIGQANYTASKAGVIGFTKTAAKELGKFGIRVNVILPGFIKTPMTDVVPDKVKEAFVSQIPLGEFGLPVDIAEVAAFLASSRSKYITAASLDVNGGLA